MRAQNIGWPNSARQGFARWIRDQDALLVTDTTLRDAHQSILATRVRTADIVAGARHIARRSPQLLSLECWGGATYDVALRFLHEDPWERLERLRDAAPNLCLQMLLRGRSTARLHRVSRHRRRAVHPRGDHGRHRHLPGVRRADSVDQMAPRSGQRSMPERWLRGRCATRGTWSTQPRTSTPSTITCEWRKG